MADMLMPYLPWSDRGIKIPQVHPTATWLAAEVHSTPKKPISGGFPPQRTDAVFCRTKCRQFTQGAFAAVHFCMDSHKYLSAYTSVCVTSIGFQLFDLSCTHILQVRRPLLQVQSVRPQQDTFYVSRCTWPGMGKQEGVLSKAHAH